MCEIRNNNDSESQKKYMERIKESLVKKSGDNSEEVEFLLKRL